MNSCLFENGRFPAWPIGNLQTTRFKLAALNRGKQAESENPTNTCNYFKRAKLNFKKSNLSSFTQKCLQLLHSFKVLCNKNHCYLLEPRHYCSFLLANTLLNFTFPEATQHGPMTLNFSCSLFTEVYTIFGISD